MSSPGSEVSLKFGVIAPRLKDYGIKPGVAEIRSTSLASRSLDLMTTPPSADELGSFHGLAVIIGGDARRDQDIIRFLQEVQQRGSAFGRDGCIHVPRILVRTHHDTKGKEEAPTASPMTSSFEEFISIIHESARDLVAHLEQDGDPGEAQLA